MPVEHFTAMIWKGSKILGIGLARSADLKRVRRQHNEGALGTDFQMVLVAYYYPPANQDDLFIKNVPKPIKL